MKHEPGPVEQFAPWTTLAATSQLALLAAFLPVHVSHSGRIDLTVVSIGLATAAVLYLTAAVLEAFARKASAVAKPILIVGAGFHIVGIAATAVLLVLWFQY